MKLFVRVICLLLALVMVGSLISAVFASEIESEAEVQHRDIPYQWYENPLYPESPALDPTVLEARKDLFRTGEEIYLPIEEAVAFVREEMVSRMELIHVAFVCDPADLQPWNGDVLGYLINLVMQHTGEPKEGDYLKLHFGGCAAGGTVYTDNGLDHYALDIQFKYYTTAEQEAALDEAVAQVLNTIPAENQSEYDVVTEIYQYMTKNIRYDYDHLEDPNYVLKYSAYAALVNGTSVCQGYTALLYRLLLERGIDCRCIMGYAGQSHSWNIVGLNGMYYFADVTWDENVDPAKYHYFLVGSEHFLDHFAEEEYHTPEFQSRYPISQTDYSPDSDQGPAVHVHGYIASESQATCVEDGYVLYTCSCGDTQTQVIPALGHEFQAGSCTRCGDADPDYVEPTEPEKPAENPFSDVNDNDYFLNPVLWAVDNGITAGTGNGNFSPNATCTRGQVVTFLWRAVGQPEPNTTENPFADVSESDYFYKPVLWALENGVTSGTGGSNFSPNNPCTRDQVVTFLWRAMGKPAPNATEHPFSDVPDNAYFFQPVLWALENGITSGTSATTFAPSNPCTRGQVVTFLYRAMN